MKTVFISVPYGISARNILRCAALKMLSREHRVVILSALSLDPEFVKEFQGPNILFRDLPNKLPFAFRALRKFLDIAEGYYFTGKSGIRTLQILKESLRHDLPGSFQRRRIIGFLLGWEPLLSWLRQWQPALVRCDYYDRLFEEFKPSMVFLTHTTALEEFPVAFYGRRLGIKVTAMLHSWDVINTKTGLRGAVSPLPGRLLPLHFDKLLIWNEIQHKELTDFLGYKDAEIEIVGIPQFDVYAGGRWTPRSEFIKRYGGNPDKKTIAYLAGNPNMLPKQIEVVEHLVQWLKEGRYSSPAQLLLRLHPGLDTNYLLRYRGHPDVLIDEPSIAFTAGRFSSGWKAGEDDERHLAEVLANCDVALNVLSTSTLDAAAFDRPVVSIAYDGNTPMPYYRSIARYYDWNHYQNLMRTNGLRVARSHEELLKHINGYLANPGLDAAGRKEIIRSHCFKNDGKAGERIGEALLKELETAAPSKQFFGQKVLN